jgi:hypothetical protein
VAKIPSAWRASPRDLLRRCQLSCAPTVRNDFDKLRLSVGSPSLVGGLHGPAPSNPENPGGTVPGESRAAGESMQANRAEMAPDRNHSPPRLPRDGTVPKYARVTGKLPRKSRASARKGAPSSFSRMLPDQHRHQRAPQSGSCGPWRSWPLKSKTELNGVGGLRTHISLTRITIGFPSGRRCTMREDFTSYSFLAVTVAALVLLCSTLLAIAIT